MHVDWFLLVGIAVPAAALGAFAVARTTQMRGFLGAVLVAGALLTLFMLHLEGRMRAPFEIVATKAFGGGALYLLIAALIVHPWRKRQDGSTPAYTGAIIFLALLAGLMIWGTVPANAASPLQGQWQVRSLRYANYEAIALIDGAGRVTFDSPIEDHGRPERFLGYIARSDSYDVEMVLTNKSAVVRVLCRMQSTELLQCVTLGAGGESAPYALVRVGPGPASLLTSN